MSKWIGVILLIMVAGGGFVLRALPKKSANAPAVTQTKLHFEEVGERLGVRFRHEEPVLDPLLQEKHRMLFAAPGVAVADFNGDGWMDLLFLTAKKGSKNHLYLNERGKRFTESAESWGIADTNQDGAAVSSTVFDFNNDGRPDVYLSGLGCSKLFKNQGDHFENVSLSSRISDCRNSVSAVPLDFDADGFLDLYVLRYWIPIDYFRLDTPYVWIDNVMNATNAGKKTLYRNRGDGTFEDVTATAGGADGHWTWDAGLVDLEGDGKLALLLANDFGADSLWAVKDGKLVDESARLGAPDRRYGMGVSVGDLDGDGRPHVHVSNAWREIYALEGNFLFQHKPGKGLVDEALERGTSNAGWAWGSAFADFDLDGRQDLYVANGFVTGTSAEQEKQAVAMFGGSGEGENSYARRIPPPEAAMAAATAGANKDYRFRAATMSTLPGAWLRDVRRWPALGPSSLYGRQIDFLFYNQGGKFTNIAAQAGITQVWDGRAVGLVDFDNNGAMDLVVTVQGGDGRPRILKNTIEPGRDWITIALRGTSSNRDGIGARVKVSKGEKSWYRWDQGGRTGFLASSDPRLHFGVPGGGPVDVEVSWPSGQKQQLTKIETGRHYTVVEGKGIE